MAEKSIPIDTSPTTAEDIAKEELVGWDYNSGRPSKDDIDRAKKELKMDIQDNLLGPDNIEE